MSTHTKKTKYKIVQEDRGFISYDENNSAVTVCLTETDCLHSLWVECGKVADDFYVVDEDGNVFCVDRGAL